MVERLHRRDASRRDACERVADSRVLGAVEDLQPRQPPEARPQRRLHAGGKEQHECRRTQRRPQPRQDEALERREQRHPAPQHQLRVVPGPGRDAHQEQQREHRERRNQQQQLQARARAPARDERRERERQPEPEVAGQEDESTFRSDHPARRPAHEPCCAQAARDLENAPGGRDEGDRQTRQARAPAPSRDRPDRPDEGQERERVHVDDRQGPPQHSLHPGRQAGLTPQQPSPPGRQQHEPSGKREQEAALRDEEGEVQVLPRDRLLDVGQAQPRERWDPREPAREEDAGDAEGPAPAAQREAGERRAGETHRREDELERSAELHRDGRQQIDAERVVEARLREDRVFRPEGGARREVPHVGPVQGQVAVVVRQQCQQHTAPLEDEPAELADGDEREGAERQPLPARPWRLRL